jgi:glycosyltransferase involved in cell wall biosynthesis
MRILHADSGREMRGGQWQALLLMRGLRELGHDTVLAAHPDAPLGRKARAEQFHVQRYGFRIDGSFDLFHAHDARSHTVLALTGRKPLVVSRRVAFPVNTGCASRWKYRQPDRYIAISNRVAACLREAGVHNAKIDVVYDGVPLPAELASGKDVLAIASADPRKGTALMEEAAAIAGVTVRFERDLAASLRHACLFLHISDDEGLGSAALLAQAAGVPVIASKRGGLVEAIEDGRTGLLVSNEAAAIAAGMKELLENPDRATAMGRLGRERVERLFTVDRMVQGTIASYERAVRA